MSLSEALAAPPSQAIALVSPCPGLGTQQTMQPAGSQQPVWDQKAFAKGTVSWTAGPISGTQ